MSRQQMPLLIDSHVHTDDERLLADRAAVLHRARAASVAAQIVPAISHRLWPRIKAVCGEHADLYPCYGLHPCFHDEHQHSHIDELASWIGREKPVAVGECGLDYFSAGANKKTQQQLFLAQLALAREFRLPVVIHARKAVEDVIRMIRSSGHYNGMIHSFNGSEQQASRLIDLGYKLSFGGAVTYHRAKKLRALVSRLPLEAILLETDAPDQPDSQHAGERNEPAYLHEVWQAISAIRPESPCQIAEATTRNAVELFALPVPH